MSTDPSILGGTLAVTGATTLRSTLVVSGATTLAALAASNVNVSGNLTIGSVLASAGTNNIYKDTFFNKTVRAPNLLVTSATTFNGAVRFAQAPTFVNFPTVPVAKISGLKAVAPDPVNVTSRLFVQNPMYFERILDISGDTAIRGLLDVSGDSVIRGRLDVSGDSVIRGRLDLSGGLDVSGASRFANDVSFIGQRVDICGNFYAQYPVDSIPQTAIIRGNIFTTDVSMHTNLAIGQLLTVNGMAKFANDVSFNSQRVDICGNLYAQYPANSIPQSAIIGGVGSNMFTTDVTMTESLNIYKSATISNNLTVLGDASFNNALKVNGPVSIKELSVASKATFNTNVDICGNLAAIFVPGSISPAAITGGVLTADTLTNDVTMTKSLNVNQNATISSNLTVLGDASFNNALKVNGPVSIKELSVASKATFNTDVDICGNLAARFVPGSISPAAITGGVLTADTLTNDVTMTKSLNVNQNATISSNLTVLGDASFNNALKVNGLVSIKELSVASRATFNADVDICGNLAARFVPGSISPAAINGGVLTADTLTNDVTLPKSLTVTDGLTSTGNTLLRGPVTLQQGMAVTNKATFNSDVDICGNLVAKFVAGSISSTAIDDGALSTRVFINDISMNKRLFVAENATFNENAYINKDLTIRGRLMVEQYTDSAIIRTTTNEYVVIVTEDLSVNGNIVIENSAKINKLTVLNDISTNGLLNVNGVGKSVFLNDLDVRGILSANFADDSIPLRAIPGLTGVVAKTTTAPNITEDVSFNKRLFVNSDISSGGLLYVNASVGDSRIKSNLTVDGFIVGQYQPGSIPTNAVNGLNASLDKIPNVLEDISLNKRLFVTSDISSSGLLYVNGTGISTIAGDLTVNGVLRAKYNVNDISSSVIKGLDASLNKIPIVFEDISLNKRLFVNSDISSGGLLHVNGLGTSVFLNDLDVRGILSANFADDSIPLRAIPGLTGVVAKTTTAPNITEDVSFNKRLFVTSDISSGGLLYVNASVGDSRIKSNLTVDGFIVGQYQPGSIPTNAVNGLNASLDKIPNVLEDISLNKRLFVTSDISSGGLLYINGTGNSKITSGLTVGTLNADNITVSGNLTVNGTTTSLNTTNLGVKDSLIELSSGLTTGTSPINDSGILINRGNQNNVFMGWNETDKKFTLGETTATGTSTGGLNVTVGTLVAKLNSDLVDINGGTIDNTSIGSSVASSGKFTSIEASSDVSMNSKLFVGGEVILKDRVDICGNLYAKYPDNSIPRSAISGGVGSNSFTGDVLVEYKLTVTNDVSMNTKLSVGGDVSMNTKLSVGGDVSMNTKLSVGGDVSVNSKLLVTGDVSMNSRLYVKGETTLDGPTSCTRDISVNGLTLGRGGGNVSSNTAFGGGALQNNGSGDKNTAIGYGASLNNNTGSQNISIGSEAAKECTSGIDNIAIGVQSLIKNTGSKNIGIGTYVGANHISGTQNTLLGYYADSANGTHSKSTAIGAYSIITASNQITLGTETETVYVPGSTLLVGDVSMNTKLSVGGNASMNSMLLVGGDVSMNSRLFVGGEVTLMDRVDICGNLYAKYPANTIPQSAIIGGVGSNSFSGDVLVEYKLAVTNDVSMNTKLSVGGDVSMNSNLTVNGITIGRGTGNIVNNTVVGRSALKFNTSVNNSAFGHQAMLTNVDGRDNAAFGNDALSARTLGSYNSAFGSHALTFAAAAGNSAIGYKAGENNRQGTYNTFLGYNTDVSYTDTQLSTGDSWHYSTAIGTNAKISDSNQITLGTATETVYVPGTLSVIGATTLATLYATYPNDSIPRTAIIGGVGSNNFTADVSMNSNLSVGGDVSMNSKLLVNGDVSMNSKLTVYGATTVGNLHASNNISVINDTSVGNTLTVVGSTTVGSLTTLGGLTSNSAATLHSSLVVGGGITSNGTNNFGLSNFSNTTLFSGVTTFQQTANFNEMVSNNALFTGNVTMTTDKTMTLNGNSNLVVGGNAKINGSLTSDSTSVTMFDSVSTINLGGASTNINIGTGAGASTIVTIGANNDTVNILGNLNITGTTTTISAVNLDISDNAITLNKGGPTATFIGAGINIQENFDLSAGYIRVGADTARFAVRLPNLAGGVEQYMVTKDNNNNLTATIGNIVMASGKYIKQF
jgi:predicted acyltransferase (DUF342 family)